MGIPPHPIHSPWPGQALPLLNPYWPDPTVPHQVRAALLLYFRKFVRPGRELPRRPEAKRTVADITRSLRHPCNLPSVRLLSVTGSPTRAQAGLDTTGDHEGELIGCGCPLSIR